MIHESFIKARFIIKKVINKRLDPRLVSKISHIVPPISQSTAIDRWPMHIAPCPSTDDYQHYWYTNIQPLPGCMPLCKPWREQTALKAPVDIQWDSMRGGYYPCVRKSEQRSWSVRNCVWLQLANWKMDINFEWQEADPSHEGSRSFVRSGFSQTSRWSESRPFSHEFYSVVCYFETRRYQKAFYVKCIWFTIEFHVNWKWKMFSNFSNLQCRSAVRREISMHRSHSNSNLDSKLNRQCLLDILLDSRLRIELIVYHGHWQCWLLAHRRSLLLALHIFCS